MHSERLKRGAAGVPGKRVVLFGPWPPPCGGVASHVQDLSGSLERRGVPVRLLCYGEFEPSFRRRRISVVRSGWWRTIVWLSLTLSPGTIFHDHSTMVPYPDGELLRSLRAVLRRKRAPWILTLHDDTLATRFAAWQREKRDDCVTFLQIPHHIICAGGRIEAFLRDLGVGGDRVSTIPPLLPLTEGASALPPLSLQAFLRDHAPVVTTIGALDPNYDLISAVQAFSAIRARHPRAGLLVIDAGFSRDEGTGKALQEALRILPAESYRRCAALPRPEVLGVLAASAVLIRGTRAESFGISRAEAILMGTPVVTTRTGESHGMDLYEFGNVEELALKALEVLARRPDLSEGQVFFRRIGERTLDRILAVYNDATA